MAPEQAMKSVTRERIARAVDGGLPIVGVALVVSAVLLGGAGWALLWLAVLGLLLVEAGSWRLGSRVMHGRRYLPLRREVQRFIGLARELNASAAVEGSQDERARRELEDILLAMRGSLDRMVEVAGKTDAELGAAAAPVIAAAERAAARERASAVPHTADDRGVG